MNRISAGHDAMAQRSIEGAVPDVRKQVTRAEVSQIVKTHIATHGVRRFADGDSGDVLSIKHFLLQRGYVLGRKGPSLHTITPVGQRGRTKGITYSQVLAFVDELRMAEGLQPIKPRTAA